MTGIRKGVSPLRNVIVTGGTRGIGASISREFIENGDRVFAVYEKNDIVAQEFQKSTGAIIIKADVSKKEGVSSVFDVVRKYGKTNVLVNNAGISEIKPFADITEEDWDKIFQVNVKSAFLMSKQALSDMLFSKKGKIINISSIWGQTGGSCEVHYSASKAAQIGFTKALAKELGLSGIQVNCVAPGVIKTDMNAHLTGEDLQALTEEIPLNRIGTPEDIAKTVFFLASDNANYITGQVFGVNGGMLI
ncbi:MAG TPA: 3-oxoacyl-ACP reductase [Clostridiales bacterium]|nr:3-oxoacyl-ACP reductase [Clostridiales bacterium]